MSDALSHSALSYTQRFPFMYGKHFDSCIQAADLPFVQMQHSDG